MIKGILFDMDGTLLDTERVAVQAEVEAAAQMGFELSREFAISLCGGNRAQIVNTLQQHFGEGFDTTAFLELSRAKMHEVYANEGMRTLPGVKELLCMLQQQGIPCAVASSSHIDTINHHLKACGIDEYFSAKIGGNMIAASKPAPDIFLAAAEALDLAAQRCAAFEDSYNGVRSAHAAGCFTIMVPDLLQPTPEIKQLCSAVLPSLLEAPALLQPLIG